MMPASPPSKTPPHCSRMPWRTSAHLFSTQFPTQFPTQTWMQFGLGGSA